MNCKWKKSLKKIYLIMILSKMSKNQFFNLQKNKTVMKIIHFKTTKTKT